MWNSASWSKCSFELGDGSPMFPSFPCNSAVSQLLRADVSDDSTETSNSSNGFHDQQLEQQPANHPTYPPCGSHPPCGSQTPCGSHPPCGSGGRDSFGSQSTTASATGQCPADQHWRTKVFRQRASRNMTLL